MSQKSLINREISARRERIRGKVLTEPRIVNFDLAGSNFPSWVVDVDVGRNRVLEEVPVKINGPKARFYARPGSPVFLEKDAQGRYQVVSPADRGPEQGNLIEVNEETGVIQVGASIGFSVVREPFEFYKGTTPESFFDPGADGNTLVWWRMYDRLGGLPNNITLVSDTDGSEVLAVADKSGNGFNTLQVSSANNPFYRRFQAAGGNTNLLSTADFDGGGDRHTVASNIQETVPGQISIFVLLNKEVVGAGDDLVLQTDDWRIFSRIVAGDTWGFDQGGGTTGSGSTLGVNFTLIELVAAGFGNVNLYQDGTLLGNFTPGGAGLGTGSSWLGSNGVFTVHNGRVAEVLMMDETVSAAKRQAIEAYFNQAMFVQYAIWHNLVDGFPKIRVLDADGNEVQL